MLASNKKEIWTSQVLAGGEKIKLGHYHSRSTRKIQTKGVSACELISTGILRRVHPSFRSSCSLLQVRVTGYILSLGLRASSVALCRTLLWLMLPTISSSAESVPFHRREPIG